MTILAYTVCVCYHWRTKPDAACVYLRRATVTLVCMQPCLFKPDTRYLFSEAKLFLIIVATTAFFCGYYYFNVRLCVIMAQSDYDAGKIICNILTCIGQL